MPQSTKDPTKRKKQALYLNYKPASEKHYEFHQAYRTTRRILCGGVGSSKSYAACYDILAHLLNNPLYRGKTALVVGLSDQNCREQLLPTFLQILTREDGRGYVRNRHYSVQLKPLRIDLWVTGSKIIFHSLQSGEGNLAGFNVTLGFLDEADKTSEATWNELYNRISREGVDGFIIGTCNPGNRSHWLAQRYFAAFEDDGVMPDNTWLAQLTIYDNPYLKHKWADWEQQYAYSPLLKQRLLMGRFISMQGLVFSNWDRERHLFNHQDGLGTRVTQMANHWPKYRGVDFGVVDAFAAVWVAHDEATECLYIYREYYQTGRSPSQNAKEVLKPTWSGGAVGAERIVRSYSDSYLETRMTLAEHDLVTTGAAKNAGSIEAGVKTIQELLEQNRLKISSNCKKLIECIESYRYNDRTGKIASNQDDNLIDALRYVTYAVVGQRRANYTGFLQPGAAPSPLQPVKLAEPEPEGRTLFGINPENGEELWMDAR